jgi:RNA polymerase sigma-70 factor, ECF subfamily
MTDLDHGLMNAAVCHWPQAFGLAYQLCRNRAEAEDLCQEAFVRFYSTTRALDRSRPLLPFLLAIVRNLAHSAARRARMDSLAMADASAALVDQRAPDPYLEAHRSEQERMVHTALRTLSPSLRAVLFLRDGLDLRYAEIGMVLGKSEDVVRVTLHRARLKMRTALAASLAESKGPST